VILEWLHDEAAHGAGNGFHYVGEATNPSSTNFMNCFHLGGGKIGIEEAVLLNIFKTVSASPEESELELFLEEP
jgi:hypothetical protein